MIKEHINLKIYNPNKNMVRNVKSNNEEKIENKNEVINLEITTLYSGRYNVLTISQEKYHKNEIKNRNEIEYWLKELKKENPSYIDFKFISPLTKKNHMDQFINKLERKIIDYNESKMQEYQESGIKQ